MIQALRHEEVCIYFHVSFQSNFDVQEDEVLSEQMTSLSLVMRKSHALALQEVPGQNLPASSSNYDFVKMDVFISPKRKHGDLALSSSSERIMSNSLYFSFKSFLDFPTISFSKKRIQEIEVQTHLLKVNAILLTFSFRILQDQLQEHPEEHVLDGLNFFFLFFHFFP